MSSTVRNDSHRTERLLLGFPAAAVEIHLRIASITDNVAFLKSSYNFSLSENQPEGTAVGQVSASSGSNLYNVSYVLKTHGELFSISGDGSILTSAELDKEEQEWYILEVEAVDTRTPPTSAVTMVVCPADTRVIGPLFLTISCCRDVKSRPTT